VFAGVQFAMMNNFVTTMGMYSVKAAIMIDTPVVGIAGVL
jgi:hypothetical protein